MGLEDDGMGLDQAHEALAIDTDEEQERTVDPGKPHTTGMPASSDDPDGRGLVRGSAEEGEPESSIC